MNKPFWKTSEFWLTIVAAGVGLTLVLAGHKELGGTMLVASLGSYSISRGLAKKAAPAFLLFVLLTGCCTDKVREGMLNLEQDLELYVDETHKVIDRDLELSEGEKFELKRLGTGLETHVKELREATR